MTTRRQALKRIISCCAGGWVFGTQIGAGLRTAYAKTKRIVLPKGAPMSELLNRNPAKLDTRNLETTPMDQFDVMGQTILPVDLEAWRLEFEGAVDHPQKMAYDALCRLPSIERNVLLICPGFFAYNGLWKGVDSAALLSQVRPESGVTHIKFSGPKGIRRKTKKFPLQEFLTNKVFLAYQVNGRPLPERHGFPVRLVAEDYYGGRWVKYVDRISFVES